MFWPKLVCIWALGVAAAGLSACGDPCRDLSEKVCNCELDPAARRSCLDKVALRAGLFKVPADSRVDAAQRRTCASLVEGCTCEKLAAGNTAACGLSLPAAAAP